MFATDVEWFDKIVVSTETAHSVWQRSVQYRGYVALRALCARSSHAVDALPTPCASTARSLNALRCYYWMCIQIV